MTLSFNHLALSVQYRTEHQFILCLIVPSLKYLCNVKTPNEIFLCLSQWASIFVLNWVLSVSIKRHMYICIFVCMYVCVYVFLAFMAQIISDWTMRRWWFFFSLSKVLDPSSGLLAYSGKMVLMQRQTREKDTVGKLFKGPWTIL